MGKGVRVSAMAEPGERYYSIEKERVVVVVEGGKRRELSSGIL